MKPPVAYVGRDFPLTVAGAAADWEPLFRTAFPFHPLARDRRCLVIDFAGPACQSGDPALRPQRACKSCPACRNSPSSSAAPARAKSRYAREPDRRLAAALEAVWTMWRRPKRATTKWRRASGPIARAAARIGTPSKRRAILRRRLRLAATTPVLVDCLTLWLSNLMLAEADIEQEMRKLEAGAGGRRRRRSSWSPTKWDLGSCRAFRSAAVFATCRAFSISASPRAPTAWFSWSRACRSRDERNAMSEPIDQAEAERHRAKMAKRKAVQDAEVAGKTIEKGLLIVHTGAGKGKSTAAFGLALRMLGRGQRVGVVQFIKGAWHTAERDALAKFGDQIVWHTMGEGFTWETQDRARDVAAAERAWAKARELMDDPSFELVILDELNIALRYDYLDLRGRRCRACRAPARSACRRHRPQRQAGTSCRRRSRHRDDAGEASLRRRREGAAGHRVLNSDAGARAHVSGHRLGCRQIADRRRAGARAHASAASPCGRSSRRTCRTMRR